MNGEPLKDTDSAESYRHPLKVTHLRKYGSSTYYICPRCNRTMEREFMCYCDRCGQCLDWKNYRRAIIVG